MSAERMLSGVTEGGGLGLGMPGGGGDCCATHSTPSAGRTIEKQYPRFTVIESGFRICEPCYTTIYVFECFYMIRYDILKFFACLYLIV